MTIDKAVSIGLTGNKISKEITGTSEVSPERSLIAAGSGATMGALASGALIVTGATASAVALPLTVAAGTVSLIASLFD